MLTNNDAKYIQEILTKYEQGEATPAEVTFIETYFNYLDEQHKQDDPFITMSTAEKAALEQEMKHRLLEEIETGSTPVRQLPTRRRFPFRWKVAAAVLLIIGAATVFQLYFRNTDQPATTTAQVNQETHPATDRAVLKLASGQEILLDSSTGNILQKKDLIVHNQKGTLQYESHGSVAELHTLFTPRSAQYQLQLPDGTQVWMNAASSITYPTVFTGNQREVSVTGEAYFEVAKNKDLPFRVRAGKTLIEVTGTHFNVNTYTDEPILTTTLLEGGVNVSSSNSKVRLSPGEQSVLSTDGQLSVRKGVNTAEIMSWKNGLFHFESADLETILRQISRWYDVDVHYEGLIPNEHFFMIIKRTSSLSAVLKALQANNVQFSIEGKKLTVKAGN